MGCGNQKGFAALRRTINLRPQTFMVYTEVVALIFSSVLFGGWKTCLGLRKGVPQVEGKEAVQN